MGQELEQSEAARLLASLEELIRQNGEVKEESRLEILGAEQPGDNFCADLILREESGFELWLGSLEDALCLRGLRQRGINAVLNCAVEECERECAVYRGCGGGRRRAHARGISAMDGAQAQVGAAADDGCNLDRDQVRAVALFEGAWYTSMLGYDTGFLGFAADDEDGYAMDRHFDEANAFLRGCRAEGRKVIVHCIMGINRSSAALAAFLCRELGLGLTPSVDLISKGRGHVLSNASFRRQLVAAYGNDANCKAEV